MGHGRTSVVTSHENMMTSVQRNPTIPMTKRDSLLTNGSRVSLLVNGTGSPMQKKFAETDYINTNPNMVAGKKRSPKLTKNVKRRDSYKIATNRQSVDDLDGLAAFKLNHDATQSQRVVRAEDRTKYNTLPRTETLIVPKRVLDSKRKKRDSGDSVGNFERNASQKSGTYPSPDTDEDQRYSQPDRKKKSTFKRMKERLKLTFKKDRDIEKDKKKTKKGDKYKSPTSRIKPNHNATRAAFKTPNEDIEIDNNHDNNNGHIKGAHATTAGSWGHSIDIGNHKSEVTHRGLPVRLDVSTFQANKSPGFFQSIRNSFRRKQAPQKVKKERRPTHTIEDSRHTGSSSQPHSGSSIERDNTLTNERLGKTSEPIGIPHSQNTTTAHVHVIKEQFIDADDSITEIFGNLIDPESSVQLELGSFKTRGPRPDTSKFRLEGLKVNRPRSFDIKSPRNETRHRYTDLSPTVEVDGFDYADAPTRADAFPEESDLEYSEVCQLEQHRRVDNVARRLAAIGDSIVSRRESESAGSSVEVDGHMVGAHSSERTLSELEEELIRDLREYADDLDASKISGDKVSKISSYVFPIVKKIILAQNYSTFRAVVHREISNTVGWEQVAWYTYLMKATMDMASASKTVGGVMRHHATRYFTSTLRPWIESRPNGWESVTEETDVDSELD